MAHSTRGQRAREAARSAGSNPYLRRVIEDEELRANIRQAYDSARGAYSRMSNGKGPTHALMDDKRVHRDLRTAAESLREASDQLRGRRRKRHPIRNLLLVGIVGAGVALVLSEDLRKSVMDRLFGAEEEFEYTSTTSMAPEPAATE